MGRNHGFQTGRGFGNAATLRPADAEVLSKARAAWSAKAGAHALMGLPAVQQMRDAGLSLRAVANDLAERGFATVRGRRWTAAQVAAILRRAGDGAEAAAE